MIGDIKGHARSLDYSSKELQSKLPKGGYVGFTKGDTRSLDYPKPLKPHSAAV